VNALVSFLLIKAGFPVTQGNPVLYPLYLLRLYQKHSISSKEDFEINFLTHGPRDFNGQPPQG
jgi:hypothetical protein